MVTNAASEAAGAAPGCVNNTRTAIGRIFGLAQTLEGRQQLRATLRLCDMVEEDSAEEIGFWIQVHRASPHANFSVYASVLYNHLIYISHL